jgi:hypothetical protein
LTAYPTISSLTRRVRLLPVDFVVSPCKNAYKESSESRMSIWVRKRRKHCIKVKKAVLMNVKALSWKRLMRVAALTL